MLNCVRQSHKTGAVLVAESTRPVAENRQLLGNQFEWNFPAKSVSRAWWPVPLLSRASPSPAVWAFLRPPHSGIRANDNSTVLAEWGLNLRVWNILKGANSRRPISVLSSTLLWVLLCLAQPFFLIFIFIEVKLMKHKFNTLVILLAV